jgi:hypothetical protein
MNMPLLPPRFRRRKRHHAHAGGTVCGRDIHGVRLAKTREEVDCSYCVVRLESDSFYRLDFFRRNQKPGDR